MLVERGGGQRLAVGNQKERSEGRVEDGVSHGGKLGRVLEVAVPPSRTILVLHALESMRCLLLLVLAFAAAPTHAQWTNRYPAVPGYSHHVYLEGFNLPTASAGITDPAPSPDGRSLAFASKGWLWLLDLEAGTARRITEESGVDSRPAWSPDGRSLAFVRDNSRETDIVVLDLEDETERVVASERGIELDPAFTPDGRAMIYSAATSMGIGLRRLDLEDGTSETLTQGDGELAFSAQPFEGGVVYLAKGYGLDEVRLRTDSGDERYVFAGGILSQSRPALSPDGRTRSRCRSPATTAGIWC